MTTRAIQHIPAHLSFGAVTCNRDNYLASVVTECSGLTCPSLPPISMTSSTSAVSVPADQSVPSPCSRHFSHRRPDPLAGFLRSRFLDASQSFTTPGTWSRHPRPQPWLQLTKYHVYRRFISQPLHLSDLYLVRDHRIAAHTLASTDVNVSHFARGYDIRMQSRRVSAPRPFRLFLVLRHIPHRHSWSSFRSGANRVRN